MVKVKEMPYSEKFALIEDIIKLDETFMPSFLQEHLGDQALVELRSIWQEGITPIPDRASEEEKYDIAYSNWIWIAKNNFSFVRNHMGEDGMNKLKRADVEALKRKNASPALFFLKIIRAVSPGTAFAMTAKQFAYQLQWITPFSVSELSRQRLVFDIPHCKILDYPDAEDLCLLGCQDFYRTWFYEQFKVNQEVNRQEKGCTMTITPL